MKKLTKYWTVDKQNQRHYHAYLLPRTRTAFRVRSERQDQPLESWVDGSPSQITANLKDTANMKEISEIDVGIASTKKLSGLKHCPIIYNDVIKTVRKLEAS